MKRDILDKKFVGCLAASLVLLITHAPAIVYAQDTSLRNCQNWQNKIERYQSLRRKGGSAEQMTKWKRAKRQYKAKFKNHRCKKYGRKLSR